MQIFLYILSFNILPIFTLIFLGYIMSKKFKLNIGTLSKLNFYIFVPIFVLVNLYTTQIPKGMIMVLLFGIVFMIMNFVIGTIISKIRNYDKPMKNAFINSVMFYNSGNIGLPLITLVFTTGPFLIGGKTPYADMAITAQIMILILQNIMTNTLGFYFAGSATMDLKQSLKQILSIPTIYMVPTAIILKFIPYDFTKFPIWPALSYIKNGYVAFALISFGVQLSYTNFNFKDLDTYISVITRLIVGPIIATILIFLFGFTGIVAQTIMISASVPTALNTALIAVEYDNCTDFASQAVMLSTIFCGVTLTVVIYLARIIFKVG